ncbi:B9 protein [Trichuris suis]|nr:B9 protein [Trichuris suis]
MKTGRKKVFKFRIWTKYLERQPSTVHAAHREDARAIGCCKPRRIRQIQRRNDGREPCRSSGQIAPSFRDLSAMQSPVVEMPVSVALCKNNLPGRSSVQKMCIMAYLGDLKTKSYDKRDEVVLCTLELIDDRYLRVTPDFNDQVEEPYLIYGRTGTYYYTVQDVSEVIEKHDEPEGAKAKVDLSRSSELRLSYDFDIPVEGCLRIFLLGEIESAVNFEYSNLFIAYCLEIPKGWSCQTEKRFGVTQLSSATYVQNAGMVSYFAMPLEFELMLDLEHYKVSDEHPEWPLLFIAVMSMDNLSRYRLEGYGYAELPRAPGREQYVVKTWRPIEQGVENLQRFFLGGSTQLESITLCRYVKSLKDDHVRKKIDFKTVSGGDVRINFYSIHQCREFAGCCKRSFIRYGSLPHGLRPSTGWNSSILQVLEAFQRARQKMITARQRDGFMQQQRALIMNTFPEKEAALVGMHKQLIARWQKKAVEEKNKHLSEEECKSYFHRAALQIGRCAPLFPTALVWKNEAMMPSLTIAYLVHMSHVASKNCQPVRCRHALRSLVMKLLIAFAFLFHYGGGFVNQNLGIPNMLGMRTFPRYPRVLPLPKSQRPVDLRDFLMSHMFHTGIDINRGHDKIVDGFLNIRNPVDPRKLWDMKGMTQKRPLLVLPKDYIPVRCKPPVCNPYIHTVALALELARGDDFALNGLIDFPVKTYDPDVELRFPLGGSILSKHIPVRVVYGHHLSAINPFGRIWKTQRKMLIEDDCAFQNGASAANTRCSCHSKLFASMAPKQLQKGSSKTAPESSLSFSRAPQTSGNAVLKSHLADPSAARKDSKDAKKRVHWEIDQDNKETASFSSLAKERLRNQRVRFGGFSNFGEDAASPKVPWNCEAESSQGEDKFAKDEKLTAQKSRTAADENLHGASGDDPTNLSAGDSSDGKCCQTKYFSSQTARTEWVASVRCTYKVVPKIY